MNYDFEYVLSDKNWRKDDIYKYLDLFIDFKVIPVMEATLNTKDEEEININLKIKKCNVAKEQQRYKEIFGEQNEKRT